MRIIPKAMKLCRLMIGLQPISGLIRWIGGEAYRGKVSGIVPLSIRKKFAFVGGLSSFSPSIKAEWVQVLPTARIDRAHSDRARSASTGATPRCSVHLPLNTSFAPSSVDQSSSHAGESDCRGLPSDLG
jgi:hypothetical protein